METFKIRFFEDEDITLMQKWLHQDYVERWYNDPEDWLNEIRKRHNEFSFLHHYIVMYNEKPIGFAQYYQCEAIREEWYSSIDLDGVYSIDYMIGEEAYLRKGLGKEIVKQLTKQIFQLANSKAIVVQPDNENIASCKALYANEYTFNEKEKFYERYKK